MDIDQRIGQYLHIEKLRAPIRLLCAASVRATLAKRVQRGVWAYCAPDVERLLAESGDSQTS